MALTASIVWVMADEALGAVDDQLAEQVQFLAHHYLVAVAEFLMEEGIPVSEVSAFEPGSSHEVILRRSW
jgi:hypothetical protein